MSARSKAWKATYWTARLYGAIVLAAAVSITGDRIRLYRNSRRWVE